MAHFAQIDGNGVVLNVTVVNNEDMLGADGNEVEQLGVDVCRATVDPNGMFVQTSYNNSFRKNYAGIGYTYDPLRDAFIPPTPYLSWVFNDDTCNWDPPVPYPDDGNAYVWDETSLNWAQIPESEGE